MSFSRTRKPDRRQRRPGGAERQDRNIGMEQHPWDPHGPGEREAEKEICPASAHWLHLTQWRAKPAAQKKKANSADEPSRDIAAIRHSAAAGNGIAMRCAVSHKIRPQIRQTSREPPLRRASTSCCSNSDNISSPNSARSREGYAYRMTRYT